MRDNIHGKDEAIKALTMTLLEKGEHNMRLSEKLAEIKNHQLETRFLNQWYLVTKKNKKGGIIELLVILSLFMLQFRFISDRTDENHFFLEIKEKHQSKDNAKKGVQKINVLDIEHIEPQHKTQFSLFYFNHNDQGGQ